MVDYRKLFEASPNPYSVLDRDLTIVEANAAFLEVTGRAREDVIGRHIFDAFPRDPDDESLRRLRKSFERVLSEGEPDTLAVLRYPIPQATSDGEVHEERYWSTTHTPLLDDEGEVAYVLQHTVDVTELREEARAEESSSAPLAQVEEGVIRRAEAVQETAWELESDYRHLRRLFEQAPVFMAFLRGPEQVFELANEAYYQLVGHRDLIGKPVRDALPEVEGQGHFELLDRVYETGEPYVGRGEELELQREPGGELETVYVDFVYQPIVEPDGSVSGVFLVGHDVTERKRAKDELRRSRERLEEMVRERTRELEEGKAALRRAEKLEAIGKLTGGVAHDFNNLLHIIDAHLHFLRPAVAGSPEAEQRLEAASEAVERGAELTSQLLSFARRQPLEPRVIDSGRLLEEMGEMIRRTVDESIEIETTVEEDLWNTIVDPYRLENVLLNLVINARDAMEGEGRLTIELENRRLDEDYAATRADVTPGRYVCLAVSDTGRGMSDEERERAFEPFFTTKGEEGTGLGLSMAYGFIKQSGGHIALYSEPGEGTTVRVYLPQTPEAEERIEEDAEPASARGGDETVMVVEDDDSVRATAVTMLQDLGYRVLEAVDGESALTILQSGVEVDLLFTDVVMPGPVRSTELAERARALFPDLEVLFTSGYTEDAIRGRLDPDVRLLDKPYKEEELAHAVRRALEGGTEPEEGAPAADRAPGGPDLRVLVVDDDPPVRRLTREVVEGLGHEVLCVADADAAIEAFEDHEVDVLLTDVHLSGRSGVELARELRERRSDLPVILATGYGQIADTESDLTDAACLTKPFDVDDLEAALAGAGRESS